MKTWKKASIAVFVIFGFFGILSASNPHVFGQFQTGGVDKPGEWYVGEGLKQGDLFSYNLCHIDYKECAEFQIDWWIEDEITVGAEKKWLAQAVVYDGNEIIKGNMELGKIAPEPTASSLGLEPYTSAYKNSIVWFSSFANANEPKAFTATSWGKIANIGGEQILPTLIETITVPAGTFETVLVTWKTGGTISKVWVVDEFPFPIKAQTWTHVSEGIPPPQYVFELLDFKENVNSDPFSNITPTEPLPQLEPEPEPEQKPPSQSLDVEINSVTKISENKFQIEVINHKNFPIGGVKIWAATYEGNTILESLTGVFDYLPAFESAHGIIQFTKTGDGIDVNLLGFHSATPRNDFSKTKFIQGESFIYPNVPVPEPEPEPQPEPEPEPEPQPEPEPEPTPTDDKIAPEVLDHSDIILSTNSLDGIEVTFTVKAIDNVDQILTPTCNPSSGSIFSVGETLVICTAVDSSGNIDMSSFTVIVEFSEFVVPEWIKDVAGFWCNDEIDDPSFVQAIQYLITNEVIVVPTTGSGEGTSEEIPDWIKNNACWWTQGLISDGDFVNGIQYLIEQGIIQV